MDLNQIEYEVFKVVKLELVINLSLICLFLSLQKHILISDIQQYFNSIDIPRGATSFVPKRKWPIKAFEYKSDNLFTII